MEAGRVFIEDLADDNVEIDGQYGLRWKEDPTQYKHGYKFRMKITDATGEITATYWGNKDEASVRAVYDSLRVNSIVRVVGTTRIWKGQLLININPNRGGLVESIDECSYDIDDLIPRTARDVDKMFSEIIEYVNEIGDGNIRAVLSSILEDEDLSEMIKRSPASVSYHCGWIGGLLEHTLNVVRSCDAISLLYKSLDRDLLLAGAILHDIGKVYCYDVSSTISESADGRMLGHIAIGSNMVEKACETLPNFPKALRLKLIHMVLASHGELEKGSPVIPSIPEAVVLNRADELDATLERYIKAREDGNEEDIFRYDNTLRTKVFLL